MFGSSMIDIAIGIVFVFLLLSVFATAINEIIMSTMNLRGKDLLLGIQTLFGGDDAAAIVAKVYNHGQIFGLYKGPFDPSKPDELPSYIPSRNFALALLDTAGQYTLALRSDIAALEAAGNVASEALAAAEAAEESWKDAVATLPRQGKMGRLFAPLFATRDSKAARTEAETLRKQAVRYRAFASKAKLAADAAPLLLARAETALEAATEAAANQRQIQADQQRFVTPGGTPPAQPQGSSTTTVATQNVVAITQDIKDGAAALAANPLTEKVGRPLVAMIAMAGDEANKLQKAVEDWYNSGMDRVSGWYKYRTQKFLLIIGFIMAVLINADTIHIARQLSIDPTLRQSIVAAAKLAKPPAQPAADQSKSTTSSTTAANPAQLATNQAVDQTTRTDTRTDTKNIQTPPPATLPDQSLATQIASANTAFDNIHTLGLPLGWPNGAPVFKAFIRHPLTHGAFTALISSGSAWEKLLGWLLTAIAISLGAPFWFDALNKIMVIRSTVKPTEKSKDEASKS